MGRTLHRALGAVPPALGALTGVPTVPQAAVTYGQADLQQHCLAFIESYTMVWLQGEMEQMGTRHGVGEWGNKDAGAGAGEEMLFWEKVLEARLGDGLREVLRGQAGLARGL